MNNPVLDQKFGVPLSPRLKNLKDVPPNAREIAQLLCDDLEMVRAVANFKLVSTDFSLGLFALLTFLISSSLTKTIHFETSAIEFEEILLEIHLI